MNFSQLVPQKSNFIDEKLRLNKLSRLHLGNVTATFKTT